MSFFKKLFQKQNNIMDWREFTEYFTEQIQQKIDGTTTIEWGKDLEETTVHLELENGAQANMYLGNHFVRYQQNPEELPEIISQTLDIIAQLGNEDRPSAQRDNIFPTVKSTAWIESLSEAYHKENKDPLQNLCIRQLAGDISVIYMIDTESSLRSLHRTETTELGIDNDDILHQIAIENLENYIRQEQNLGYRQSENGLYQIYLDEIFDASLILLLEKILDVAELDFAPYPVFAIPSRDMLLVCAADNQAALVQMQQTIDEVMQDSSYCISEYIYCLKNGQIALFNTH